MDRRATLFFPPEEAIDQAGWMHTGDLATLDANGYAAVLLTAADLRHRLGRG